MYQISVEKHYDAAHYLRGYRGKCEALHGHRFTVVARLKAAELDDIGLAYDYAELKKHLDEVLARLDHTCVNDISPFDTINPSSENMARYIYDELAKLVAPPATVAAVEVWESPHTWVSYTPD
jgi:6-pyruvoyltetrahydropterin/6-carboxytetrahydropterin synthase